MHPQRYNMVKTGPRASQLIPGNNGPECKPKAYSIPLTLEVKGHTYHVNWLCVARGVRRNFVGSACRPTGDDSITVELDHFR